MRHKNGWGDSTITGQRRNGHFNGRPLRDLVGTAQPLALSSHPKELKSEPRHSLLPNPSSLRAAPPSFLT